MSRILSALELTPLYTTTSGGARCIPAAGTCVRFLCFVSLHIPIGLFVADSFVQTAMNQPDLGRQQQHAATTATAATATAVDRELKY